MLTMERFAYCNQLIEEFEKVIEKPIKQTSQQYFTGVDLGTSCIVLSVLNDQKEPVAGAYRYASVVKDGMIVDYLGAIQIVKELKDQLEEKLGVELLYCAAALPPGTATLDSGVIRHVVEGAGFELTALLDEPTAANAVLKIENGAIVDIGGGTTGITILENGQVVHVVDEATGGTHFSLVVAGSYHISFEEADVFKRDEQNHQELLPVLTPVIEKVASIVNQHVQSFDVKEIYLVGGTCCLTGIEKVIEKQTKIPTFKPDNPMFVTPLGIALNCQDEIL
ncbi:ethanolamine utilization protein EutJ [Enterococcus sp. PF1-24]|uniref:ethanolamine utilization protein EutJ n=1 Tax=unclassified Enterococcus TaxID=2608891 RepID=UPI002473ECAA|nr:MULTISPECIES: ethanolamine utilization protein EutJ [unclassified Enterococcus]MDH6364085.1 ethanolamine utilization protein EutJ [Enterococcus sp. PFB1-1]MDH6401186.1 ethanolamine utilization protein EutJ [Enterococcus sp. PF1-24]